MIFASLMLVMAGAVIGRNVMEKKTVCLLVMFLVGSLQCRECVSLLFLTWQSGLSKVAGSRWQIASYSTLCVPSYFGLDLINGIIR
jgi:hypothetical protein